MLYIRLINTDQVRRNQLLNAHSFSWKTHLRATEPKLHLPFSITQCHLSPDIDKCGLPYTTPCSQAGWYSIYLPTKRRKAAELTLVLMVYLSANSRLFE